MTALCQQCDALSIEALVELAEDEFVQVPYAFPSDAFYQHHSSFGELEISASKGCVLCQLILKCFRGKKAHTAQGTGWMGENYDPDKSDYALAKRSSISDVRLCLSSSHLYRHNQGLDDVKGFDQILVKVGPSNPFEQLVLLLRATSGKCSTDFLA